MFPVAGYAFSLCSPFGEVTLRENFKAVNYQNLTPILGGYVSLLLLAGDMTPISVSFFCPTRKKYKNCTFGTLNGTATRVSLCCVKKSTEEKRACKKLRRKKNA